MLGLLAAILGPGVALAQEADLGTADAGAEDLGAADLGLEDLGTEDVGTPDAGPAPDRGAPPDDSQGLVADYFANTELRGPGARQVDPQVYFPYGNDGPEVRNPVPDSPPVGVDAFSVRWQGQVTAAYSERYTFFTYSDDGVRLWVDGQLLIDNWTGHGRTRDEGQVTLRAGVPVPILLEYYEGGGAGTIELGWVSPSQVEEFIPAAALTPEVLFPAGAPTLVGLRVGDDRAAEGMGDTARFTVFRWGPLGAAIQIPIVLSGDAEAGVDYVALPATLELAAHQHARTFEVVPTEDDRYRGTRVLELALGAGPGFSPGPAANGRIEIIDDERPPAPERFAVVGEVSGAPAEAAVVVTVDGPSPTQRVVLGNDRFSVGDLLPGDYTVRAFADLNGDGVRGEGEPAGAVEGAAEHRLRLPPDSPLLAVTFGAGGGGGAGGGAGGGTGDGGPEGGESAAKDDGGCAAAPDLRGHAPHHVFSWAGLLTLALLRRRRRVGDPRSVPGAHPQDGRSV